MNPEPALRTPVELDSDRLALVGRIADDLAHEIRNPVHAMIINLEVLRRGLDRGAIDMALERAAIVDAELLRVQRLIEPLLQLLRQRPEEARAIDIDEIVNDVTPLLEARARVAGRSWNITAASDAVVHARPDELRLAVLAIADAMLTIAAADEPIAMSVAAAGGTIDVTFSAAAAGDASGAVPVREALVLARTLIGHNGGQLTLATAGPERAARFTATMSMPRDRPA